MMKHLFLLNPVAGKYDRSHEVLTKIQDLAAYRSLDWEAVTTKYPGHGTELSRAAAEKGDPVRIYACGGDGTLNEAVNGAAGFSNAAIAQFPCGSGNDFLRLFGPDTARFYDLRELVDGDTAPMDLIDCNGRLSINICSVGLDARIGHGMTNFKSIPGVSGPMAYQLSLITNVIHGIHRPYHVEVDGEVFSGSYTLLCACNGRYYGGGFYPAPSAQPDDGALDFLIVKAVSRLTVATVVDKYAKGKAAEYPALITLRRGQEMKIECDRVSAINIDGERMDTDKLSFRLSAKKVNFIFPQGAHWNLAQQVP